MYTTKVSMRVLYFTNKFFYAFPLPHFRGITPYFGKKQFPYCQKTMYELCAVFIYLLPQSIPLSSKWKGIVTMEKEQLRNDLIQSAIHVVAQYGLDKTTTKRLAGELGINEVYIYRAFKDKDALLTEAFIAVDNEFSNFLLSALPVMEQTEIPISYRCFLLFSKVWQFILSDKEKCLFFILFYYSRYFNRLDIRKRNERYRKVIAAMAPAFTEGTDVWGVLNHIFDTLFSSALKVIRGEITESETTPNEIFQRIYLSVSSHLTWTQKQTNR